MRDFGRVYVGSDGSGIVAVTLGETESTAVRHSTGSPFAGLEASPNPVGERVPLTLESARAFGGELTWYTPAGLLIGVLQGAGGTTVVRVLRE